MADAGTDEDRDVARRCRALTQLYAGGTSSTFAERIGISPTRWNNIEGSGALTRDLARRITRKFPEISLDWLLRGKDNGMTRAKSDEFLAAYKKVVAAQPVPKGRKTAS